MDDGTGNIAMGFYKEAGYKLNAKYASGDEYSTPWPTFQYLNQWMIANGHRYFNLDPFSSAQSHKTPRFFTKRDNGYIADWEDRRAFCNPPFAGGGLIRSTTKMVDAARHGATVGGLLPGFGIGDPWAINNIMPFASEVLWIEGRIRFLGSPHKPSFRATFASVFVLWVPGLRPAGTEIRTSWIKCPLSADDPVASFGRPSRQPKPLPKWASGPQVATQEGVVLSLFDRTGNIVRPWAEAGYECIAVDLQHPPGETRRGLVTFVGANIREWWPPPRQYKIVFAAPPCSNLAVSGAPHFRAKGLEGLTAGLELVQAARRICEWSRAPWMIENPVSVLSSHWREPDFTFDPFEFGAYDGGKDDGYTKRTCLWTSDDFQFPEKRPILVSRQNLIHHMSPSPDRSDLRSVTPPGFSRAVFEANQ
jgi:hypothetical protein